MTKRILLWGMPDEAMLIIEHASGVVYQNQVGGTACWQAEQEGILAPLELWPETKKRIFELQFIPGAQGITLDFADALDALLAGEPTSAAVRVDRARLGECWEAWIYVTVDSPVSAEPLVVWRDYPGSVLGFGRVRGVLTWPNSD
jgi:hypothetical protein